MLSIQVDYFERAKRLEEIPLLQKSLEEKQVQDKAFWEQQEKERIEQLIGMSHFIVCSSHPTFFSHADPEFVRTKNVSNTRDSSRKTKRKPLILYSC